MPFVPVSVLFGTVQLVWALKTAEIDPSYRVGAPFLFWSWISGLDPFLGGRDADSKKSQNHSTLLWVGGGEEPCCGKLIYILGVIGLIENKIWGLQIQIHVGWVGGSKITINLILNLTQNWMKRPWCWPPQLLSDLDTKGVLGIG